MIQCDDCFSCVHNFYETDEDVYCSDCNVQDDGEMSNYEPITDEDIELFVDELKIKVVDDADLGRKVKEIISEPAD